MASTSCAPSARALSLSTPILVEDRSVGVLTAHRDAVGAWSRGDVLLIEAVAAEAGLTIRLARLLAENRERLGQQTALLRAAQVLSGELEVGTVLERLVDEVAELLQADASDCYLTTATGASSGAPRCTASTSRSSASSSPSRAASPGLRSARAARSSRATTPSSPSAVPHEAYEGFTDAIVAPMRWSDDVQGVLGVGRRSGLAFTSRDADMLEAFAGLASLALRNAETYTRSSRQARVQRGFYRVASVLGQSLSRAATLEAIAQAAAEALGGAAAAVLMTSGAKARAQRLVPARRRIRAVLREGIESGGGPLVRAAAQGRVLAAPTLDDDERLPAAWRERAAGGRLPRAARGARRVAAARGGRPRRSSSSRRSGSSPRTISSWRGISPTRRAARSSAASCSRQSEARGRSPSS